MLDCKIFQCRSGTLDQQASYYLKLLTIHLLCLSHRLKKSDLISSNMKEFHDDVSRPHWVINSVASTEMITQV